MSFATTMAIKTFAKIADPFRSAFRAEKESFFHIVMHMHCNFIEILWINGNQIHKKIMCIHHEPFTNIKNYVIEIK